MAITTRSGKGSPLTHNEMDANLSAITEKTSATGSVKGSSGTTAQRPASPVEGYTRFNTTLNRHETYNGSTWITAVSSANTDTSDMSFVVDEDAMTSDSATKVPTQQSVKAYVDSQVQSKDALSELSGTLDDVADGTTYVKSTNDFTDAEVTKLSGIETAATADQTNAEIKTAYEANADTNEFSDAEQTKLSGIEASADVTDSTNVASAGAVMESDTTTASMSFVIDQDDMSTDSATKVPTQQSVKAYVDSQVQSKDTLGELGGNLDDITDGTTYKKMSATEQTKLSGIEASADVTDTTNVTSAGALMDSEVTNLAQVKAFDTTDYATSTQGTTADAALPKAGGTMTGDVSLGDNVKAKFGASDDLEVYHDGSNSYIKDTGTGDLKIWGAGVEIATAGGNKYFEGAANVARLYHTGNEKLATTNNGIDVTGSVTCDGFTSTGIDDNATSTAITIDASENVTFAGSVTCDGFTSETGTIQLKSTSGNTNIDIHRVDTSIGDANGLGHIRFTAEGSGSGEVPAVEIQAVSDGAWSAGSAPGALSIKTTPSGAEASTERMRIAANGNVEVATGNLVIGTSGKGIDFSATAGTGTSELLDDYEEGDYTITLTPQTSGTLPLWGNQDAGAYTKVGRVVTVTGYAYINGPSSPVGTYISVPLPFPVADLLDSAEHAGFTVLENDSTVLPGYILASGTTFRIVVDAATAINGDKFGWTFSYFT